MEFSCTQTAKLVLGYLKSENCMKAHHEFMRSCRYLKDVNNKPGKAIMTRFLGMSLIEILSDYADIYTIVQESLEETDYFNERNRCHKVSHQLQYLLDDHGPKRCSTPNFISCCAPHPNNLNLPPPSLDIQATQLKNLPGNANTNLNSPKSKGHLPATQTSDSNETESDSLDDGDVRNNESAQMAVHAFAQSLLDQHDLTRKLAENINEVIENKDKLKDSGACDDIDSAIKAVLDKTQSDPAFDTLMGEIIGSVSVPLNHNLDAIQPMNKEPLLTPNSFNNDLHEQNKIPPLIMYPPLNIDTKTEQQKNVTLNTNSGDIIVYDGSIESYMKNGSMKTQANIEHQKPNPNLFDQDILKMPVIVADDRVIKPVRKVAVKKVKTIAPRQTALAEFITLYKCNDSDGSLNKSAEGKCLKTLPPRKKVKDGFKYEIHIPIETRPLTPADNIIATASYPNGLLASGIPDTNSIAKVYSNPNLKDKKKNDEQIALSLDSTQIKHEDVNKNENIALINNSNQLKHKPISQLESNVTSNILSTTENIVLSNNKIDMGTMMNNNQNLESNVTSNILNSTENIVLSNNKSDMGTMTNNNQNLNNTENHNKKQILNEVIDNQPKNVTQEVNKNADANFPFSQNPNLNNICTQSQNVAVLENENNSNGIEIDINDKTVKNHNKMDEITQANQDDNTTVNNDEITKLNENLKPENSEKNGPITEVNNEQNKCTNKIVRDLQSIQSQTDILKSIQAHSEDLLAKNERVDTENLDATKKNNRTVTITDVIDVKKLTPEIEVKKKEVTPGEKSDPKKNSSTPRSGNKSHVRALDFKFNTPPSSDMIDIKTSSPSKRKSPNKAKTAKSLFKSPMKTNLIVKKKELVKSKKLSSWDADLRNQIAEDPTLKKVAVAKSKPKKQPVKPKSVKKLKIEDQAEPYKPPKKTRGKTAKSPQKVITVTTDLQNACVSIVESEGKVEDVLKSNENSQITLIKCNAKPRYNRKCNITNPTSKEVNNEPDKDTQSVKNIVDSIESIVKQSDITVIETDVNIKQTTSPSIAKHIKSQDASLLNKSGALDGQLNDSMSKGTILDMEDLIKIDNHLEGRSKFLTPEVVNKVSDIPATVKKNIIPILETPIKDIYPKTPSALSPTVEDTPFTKVFKDQFADIDLSTIQTPKFLNTPNFPFTPLLDGQSPRSNRGTDYSTSSSYYQPSDTEQNKCLEMFIKEECKRPQVRRITPIKVDEPMDIEKPVESKIQVTAKSLLHVVNAPPVTKDAEKAMVEKMKSFSGNLIARKNLSLMPRKNSSDESSSDESSESETSDSSGSSNSEEDSVIKTNSHESNTTQYSLRSSKANTSLDLSEPPVDDIKSIINVTNYKSVLPGASIPENDEKKKKVLAELEIKRRRTLEKLKNGDSVPQKPMPRKRAPPKGKKSPVKKQPVKRNLRSSVATKPVDISPKQKLRTMMDMEMTSSDDDELKPLQVVETEMLSSKSNTPLPETLIDNKEKVLVTFEQQLNNLSQNEEPKKVESKDVNQSGSVKDNLTSINKENKPQSKCISKEVDVLNKKLTKNTKDGASNIKTSMDTALSTKCAKGKTDVDISNRKCTKDTDKSIKEKTDSKSNPSTKIKSDGVANKSTKNKMETIKSVKEKISKEITPITSNSKLFEKPVVNNIVNKQESSLVNKQQIPEVAPICDKDAQCLVDGLKERGIFLMHNKEKPVQPVYEQITNSNECIEEGEIVSDIEYSPVNKKHSHNSKKAEITEDLFGVNKRRKSLHREKAIDEVKVGSKEEVHRVVKKTTKLTDIVKKTVNTKKGKSSNQLFKKEDDKRVRKHETTDVIKKIDIKKQETVVNNKEADKTSEAPNRAVKDSNEAIKNDELKTTEAKDSISGTKKVTEDFYLVDTSFGEEVEFDFTICSDIIQFVYNPNEEHTQIVTDHSFLKRKKTVDIYTEVHDKTISRPIEVIVNDDIFNYKPPLKRRATIRVIGDIKINKSNPLKVLHEQIMGNEQRVDLATSSPLEELYETDNKSYSQQKVVKQNLNKTEKVVKKEVKTDRRKSDSEKGLKNIDKSIVDKNSSVKEERTKTVDKPCSSNLQPSIYSDIPPTPIHNTEFDLMDYSLALCSRKRKPEDDVDNDNKRIKPENGIGILKKVDIEGFLNMIHSTPN